MNFISSTLRCAISCPLLNHLREGQWDARRSLLLFPKAYSVPHLFNFSFLWKLNSLLWMWCRAVWHVCTQTPCRKPCKESVACLPAQGRAGSCSAPQAHTSWTLPAGLWRWGLHSLPGRSVPGLCCSPYRAAGNGELFVSLPKWFRRCLFVERRNLPFPCAGKWLWWRLFIYQFYIPSSLSTLIFCVSVSTFTPTPLASWVSNPLITVKACSISPVHFCSQVWWWPLLRCSGACRAWPVPCCLRDTVLNPISAWQKG